MAVTPCLIVLLCWQPLVWVSGVVQTLLYADFFYYYWLAIKEGSKFQLPG